MLPKFWMWGWRRVSRDIIKGRGKNNSFAPPSHKTLRSSIYPRGPRGDHKHKQSAQKATRTRYLKWLGHSRFTL